MRECRPRFHLSAIPVAWTSAGFGVPSPGSAGEPPFAVEDPSRRTSTSSAATGKPARSSSLRNPVGQPPIRAQPGRIRLCVTPTGGIPTPGPYPAVGAPSRLLSAGALAVLAPWPAAGPTLAFLQLLLGPANAAFSGHLLLGILDPADELVAG